MQAAGDVRRAAVVGTGQMGPGIAMLLAHGGLETTLVSRSATGAEAGLSTARTLLNFWRDHEVTTPEAVVATLPRLTATSDRASAVRTADLVIETVVEDLQVKQALFRQLEEEVREDTVLCTNTSGLRITDIAALMRRPERAYTTHFWNPPHLVPLVEIIVGERSDPAGAGLLRDVLTACGKRPVIGLKDVPGQVANRLQHAVLREAMYMLETGVASARDIEESLKAGPGLRWPVYGIFEHHDFVGMPLARAVQAAVLPSLASNQAPSRIFDEKIAAGQLGASTGQGIYSWTPRQVEAVRRRRDAFLVERLREERRSRGAEDNG